MLVEQAKTKFDNHELYWAADLMVELEKVQQGRALDWAIECVKALVETCSPPEQVHLLDQLSKLSALTKKPVDGPALMEVAQQIWHEQPGDVFHMVISHLYAALSYLYQQNISWYRRSIVTATDVMGDHEYCRQTSMAIPLAMFEQFKPKAA